MVWWWIASCILCLLIGRFWQSPPGWLLYWHGQIARLRWRWKSRWRGGRPRIDDELIRQIVQMKVDNPTWGAPRIHGELLKLGFRVSQSTVSKYMPRRPASPSPGWKAFLNFHRNDIAAIDMLTVWTVNLERLYAVVIVGLGRRRILHVEVTDHPTAIWLAGQITEAFGWDEPAKWLIRDNDGAYGWKFRRRLKAMGIRDRPTMPRSPWQNGYVERLIGSIRRECLNFQLILNASHLRRVLREYADYYNGDRTHLGLGKDAPDGRAVEAVGRIVSKPVLGGLHHRYRRGPPK